MKLFRKYSVYFHAIVLLAFISGITHVNMPCQISYTSSKTDSSIPIHYLSDFNNNLYSNIEQSERINTFSDQRVVRYFKLNDSTTIAFQKFIAHSLSHFFFINEAHASIESVFFYLFRIVFPFHYFW